MGFLSFIIITITIIWGKNKNIIITITISNSNSNYNSFFSITNCYYVFLSRCLWSSTTTCRITVSCTFTGLVAPVALDARVWLLTLLWMMISGFCEILNSIIVLRLMRCLWMVRFWVFSYLSLDYTLNQFFFCSNQNGSTNII